VPSDLLALPLLRDCQGTVLLLRQSLRRGRASRSFSLLH
jgi:hypothetical protein